jgi:hypothetical protein
MAASIAPNIPSSPNTKVINMTQTGANFGNEDSLPRISFLDIFNHLKHMSGHSLEIDRGSAGAAARGTWKIKSIETTEIQKAVLQHEKLGDHLKTKTYWKRHMIINKYKNEDGTMEDPPIFEDLHPECNLY